MNMIGWWSPPPNPLHSLFLGNHLNLFGCVASGYPRYQTAHAKVPYTQGLTVGHVIPCLVDACDLPFRTAKGASCQIPRWSPMLPEKHWMKWYQNCQAKIRDRTCFFPQHWGIDVHPRSTWCGFPCAPVKGTSIMTTLHPGWGLLFQHYEFDIYIYL